MILKTDITKVSQPQSLSLLVHDLVCFAGNSEYLHVQAMLIDVLIAKASK